METGKSYKIPFVGLKEGKHTFEFTTNKEFFEDYKYNYISVIQLVARIELQKMSTMMIMDFHLSGKYATQCDRCGDDLLEDFKSENRMFVKFGEGESNDENILLLDQSQFEIDVSELIFEFFVVSVSSKNVHDIADCNQEVLNKIDELRAKEQKEESNPIWDKLKELKNKE